MGVTPVAADPESLPPNATTLPSAPPTQRKDARLANLLLDITERIIVEFS